MPKARKLMEFIMPKEGKAKESSFAEGKEKLKKVIVLKKI
jgi:hypothetical protein